MVASADGSWQPTQGTSCDLPASRSDRDQRHETETVRRRDERPPRLETGDKRNRKQQDGGRENNKIRDERPPRRETGHKRNRKQEDGEAENSKMRDERQATQGMMSEA